MILYKSIAYAFSEWNQKEKMIGKYYNLINNKHAIFYYYISIDVIILYLSI